MAANALLGRLGRTERAVVVIAVDDVSTVRIDHATVVHPYADPVEGDGVVADADRRGGAVGVHGRVRRRRVAVVGDRVVLQGDPVGAGRARLGQDAIQRAADDLRIADRGVHVTGRDAAVGDDRG